MCGAGAHPWSGLNVGSVEHYSCTFLGLGAVITGTVALIRIAPKYTGT